MDQPGRAAAGSTLPAVFTMHRRTYRVAATVTALLVAIAVSGCSLQPDVSTRVNGQTAQLTDTPAPALVGTTLSGARIDLASYRGHPVVLDFWGSWCVPCQEEQAEMNGIVARYAPRGVRFVGVDLRDSSAADALAFVAEHKVTYPSIYDPGSDAAATFNVDAPPTTIIIDATGHIRIRDLGNLVDIPATLDTLLGGTA